MLQHFTFLLANKTIHHFIYTSIYIQCNGEMKAMKLRNSGYRNSELTSVNMLPKRNLCSTARTSGEYVIAVYRIYSIRTRITLMLICEK
jgi:hypothetical protein